MTVEYDNIYEKIKDYPEQIKENSASLDALEIALELEVQIFRIKKKMNYYVFMFYSFVIAVIVMEFMR